MGNSHQDCQHNFWDSSRMGIKKKSHSEKERGSGKMHRKILLSYHKIMSKFYN